MLEIFFAAIVAHYIADYPLQGAFLSEMKGKLDYILFCHVIIWTGCVCAVLGYFGIFAWWKVAFLSVGHFIIDRWKARKSDKINALKKDLWIDQFLHFIQIVIVVV